jgi:hypothetical protein
MPGVRPASNLRRAFLAPGRSDGHLSSAARLRRRLTDGHQGVQRGGQLVHLHQRGSSQLRDQLLTGLGELDPGHPGVLGIRAAAHEARRFGPVHQAHRAVAAQQQVIGDLTDRRGNVAGMALYRHQELMLDMRQAYRTSLVFAPALEAAQRDPEREQVLGVQAGWLSQGATSITVPAIRAYRAASTPRDAIRVISYNDKISTEHRSDASPAGP